VKLSDSFHAKKTTLCVTTLDPSVSKTNNATALVRTMKGMRAALAGVPIVSPDWIRTCLIAQRVIVPETSMYVRTLPVKVPLLPITDHGVAHLAAGKEQGAPRPLETCSVFLCSHNKDAVMVLRDSGATILSHSSQVRNGSKSNSNAVYVVCHDKSTLTETLSHAVVVNPNWIYDSISSGVPLDAVDYPPF
jgi:hypothetical protein